MRTFARLLFSLVALPTVEAAGLDNPGHYPSPAFSAPVINRLWIDGAGQTGDVSGMSVKPSGHPSLRSLADLLDNVVYAKNFGMVCQLTVNDTPALQAAINYAEANKAREVVMPSGQCRLDAAVTIRKPLVIRGSGMAAGSGEVSNTDGTIIVVNFPAGDVFAATGNFSFTFRDFQINSNVGKRTSGAGIRIRTATSPANGASKVERVAFNNQYVGVHCTSCHHFEMTGTYHQAWARSAYLADGTVSDESLGGYIHHNWMSGDGSAYTTQTACIESRVGYIRITHNTLIGAGIGIFLQYDIRPAGSTAITDNTLENQAQRSIFLRNAAGVTANNVQISRNEFMVTGADSGPTLQNFIHILANSGGTGSWIDNVQVNENTFAMQMTASGTIAAMNISSGTNVTVLDNTTTHLSGSKAYDLIVGAEATNVRVVNQRKNGTSTVPKYNVSNITTQLDDVQGLTLSELPPVASGSQVYVTDGLRGSAPLVAGGYGTMARRINGEWLSGDKVLSTYSTAIFTASGSFTAPTGTGAYTAYKVTVVGGGGGGAAGLTNNITGGGAGAGAMAVKRYQGLVPGKTYAVTVGSGGTAGEAGAASSFVGPFAVTVTAGGGAAGGQPTAGTGGTPTGGDLNVAGGSGTNGSGGTVAWASGGSGGASSFGSGGAGGVAATAGTNGSPGVARGSGGGAGNASPTAAGRGASGATGVVIIEWVP